jgi:phosphonopyruvate decarboxylase
MIDCATFYGLLKERGFEFYAGVPDSLLKNFCYYVADTLPPSQHIITANEGSAVSLGAGYHLATGRIPTVYLQNSGTGNTINPLLSLADPDVYGIPMLLIIGWRGEPGVKDEPQHKKQGRVMEGLLKSMEIPYEVLDADSKDLSASIDRANESMRKRSAPYVLLMREGCFSEYAFKGAEPNPYPLSREQAIDVVLDACGPEDVVICTTGKASRELFELRKKRHEANRADFLVVGSMGHASQIALGMALQRPKRKVICIDGDGSLLMHTGGMATIGRLKPKNLVHVLINNGAHESVGGQGTGAFDVDWPAIAKAFRYADAKMHLDEAGLRQAIAQLKADAGPVLIEVRTKQGSRRDLGRPTSTPLENKQQLMKALLS